MGWKGVLDLETTAGHDRPLEIITQIWRESPTSWNLAVSILHFSPARVWDNEYLIFPTGEHCLDCLEMSWNHWLRHFFILIMQIYADIKLSAVTLWHSTQPRSWQVHLPDRVPSLASEEAHLTKKFPAIEEFLWKLWCWTGTTIPQNMRFSALYLSPELVFFGAGGVSHR